MGLRQPSPNATLTLSSASLFLEASTSAPIMPCFCLPWKRSRSAVWALWSSFCLTSSSLWVSWELWRSMPHFCLHPRLWSDTTDKASLEWTVCLTDWLPWLTLFYLLRFEVQKPFHSPKVGEANMNSRLHFRAVYRHLFSGIQPGLCFGRRDCSDGGVEPLWFDTVGVESFISPWYCSSKGDCVHTVTWHTLVRGNKEHFQKDFVAVVFIQGTLPPCRQVFWPLSLQVIWNFR